MGEGKTEVTIISRDITRTWPRMNEMHYEVIVTYSTKDLVPAIVTIDLYEHFGDKQEEAAKQIAARKGPLWEKYLAIEKETIRKDIELRKAYMPETYTI